MLDCFDGLVTLDNTCAGSTGALPLQMHGINETLLGRFTGPEDTAASLLANCEAWARATMQSEALAHMGVQVVAKSILDQYAVGQTDEDQELMTDSGIGGFMIETGVPGSNLKITIGMLGLYAQQTGDVTITIYDLEDGTVAATYVLAATADQVSTALVQIELPAYRRSKRYFVTHDLTSFYRTDTNGGCGTCSHSYGHGGVYITGARMDTGVPVKRSNIRTVSHSSGLSAVVTVGCDHGRMLCEVKDMLALAYSLKVAEGVYRWGIKAVDRQNNDTVDREALEKEAMRLNSEYRAELNTVLGRMRLPRDPLCFACNTPTRSVVSLPA